MHRDAEPAFGAGSEGESSGMGPGDAVDDGQTVVYAHTKHWATVIPAEAWAGGLGASVIIGALAGLMPALRAAHLPPTQALWSV